MKTLSLTLLVASTLGLTAASVSARTGELVDFTYTAQELATDQGREALLDRMRTTTFESCSGTQSKAYWKEEDCRTDLEKQFIEAIDNPELIAQYEDEPVRVARNSS